VSACGGCATAAPTTSTTASGKPQCGANAVGLQGGSSNKHATASWLCSPECERCVAAAVVELNTLSNPVGPTTQDEDLAASGGCCLTAAVIGGVHVGGVSLQAMTEHVGDRMLSF
jgi:hypothetical protein